MFSMEQLWIQTKDIIHHTPAFRPSLQIILSKRTLKDRISELPDAILSSIISPMRMEEAVKTSLLSSRWRYLWANQTHLHFNHLILFSEIVPDVALSFVTADQKAKYINWVNQVVNLALHCSPCIDTFKVQFMFDNNAAHHIDKWVRFATSKKVKHLQLTSCNANNVPYSFEFDLLKPSPSLGDGDISFLVSLHLDGINITGDVLEFLLSRCHLLEQLHVHGTRALKRLKVRSPFKLKRLRISSCIRLVDLEIDAPSLVSFHIDGVYACSNLVFKSIRMLVELTVSTTYLTSILLQVPDLAGQLSKLTLVLSGCKIYGEFPTFSYLKQLTLKFEPFGHLRIAAITTWLESCQMVREVTLELPCRDIDEIEMGYDGLKKLGLGDDDVEEDDTEDEVEEEGNGQPLQRKSHPNIKVLHVVGFSGCYRDVWLILYFVNFACNLETIICDTSRHTFDIRDAEFVEASKSRASKLTKILPPKICLDII